MLLGSFTQRGAFTPAFNGCVLHRYLLVLNQLNSFTATTDNVKRLLKKVQKKKPLPQNRSPNSTRIQGRQPLLPSHIRDGTARSPSQ